MITVRADDRLKAVVLAMKAADRDVRNEINRATRATLGPEWKSMVELHATYRLDTAVLAKGARILAGDPPVAVAATSTRPLPGRLVPADRWQVVEFGAHGIARRTYTTKSRRGRSYQITRHTQHQLPDRVKTGRVLYPAFEDLAPRAAALWAQLVTKIYLDAADKAGD